MPTIFVNSDVGDGCVGPPYIQKMELSERLKFARKRARLTQDDVARHFGINRVSVTQWELDSSRPDQSKFVELAALLGVPLLWLMDGTGPEPDEISPEPKNSGPGRSKFLKTSNRKFYVREWREHAKERVENAAMAAGLSVDEYEAFETHPVNFTLAQLEAIADEIGVAGHQFWFPPPRKKEQAPPAGSRVLRRNGKRI